MLAESINVALDQAVFPHLGVHGGGQEDGAGGHEEGGGEHVAGGAGGDAGEEIRGGGDNNNKVCLGADRDVPYLRYVGENTASDGLPGEGFEGGGANELGGGRGGDGGDGVAGFGELTNDHAGFVGGYSSTYADDNIFVPTGVRVGVCLSLIHI